MSYSANPWSKRRWDGERLAIRLYDAFGIRVFLHLFSVILMALQLLNGVGQGHLGATAAIVGMLFAFVLLHEYGHCFGCRAVGGSADEILMWPLGGLAFCMPPHRACDHLMTVLAGPAVNLAFFVVLAPILLWQGANWLDVINPFADVYLLTAHVWWPLAFACKVNLWLFCFNVFLPVFPLDGGRILQCILWMRIGYGKAGWLTANVGMIVAAVVGGVSLYNRNLWTFGIMLFGFFECMKMRRQLEAEALNRGEFGDFSEGYSSLERSYDDEPASKPKRPSLMERYRNWRRQRAEARAEAEESEVDRILEKINTEGLASLSAREKKILTEASERQRKRRG